MTTFAYKAISAGAGGRVVTGAAQADSADAVRDRLRAQGLVVVELKPQGGLTLGAVATRGRRTRSADTAWFFQTLRRLLAAKVPIEEALRTMIDLAPTPASRHACETTHAALRSGESLAVAVEKSPGLARPEHLALLRVGHESGRLDHCVALVERSITAGQRLRRTVVSKLIYPAILVAASVVAVWILATFVIPKFAETLASAGASLPAPTKITLAASRWLMWIVPPMLAAAALVIAAPPASIPESWRRRLDATLLRLPIARDLVRLRAGAVVADTVATMLAGGGDLLGAMDLARSAVSSPSIADRLAAATRAVREGADPGEAMHQHAVLPPEADALVRIGARSGDLVGALEQASAVCVEKQEAAAERLLTLMGPAIILVLASVVGWVVYSLIAGMLSMNDLSALG